MACVYEYNGKTLDRDDFIKLLLSMKPAEASKFMPGVKSMPNAPFIGSTKNWSVLSIKRMVRYAAENGFDSIAWTPGDVQAERYDLSKQVDSIDVLHNGYPGSEGTFDINADKDGHVVFTQQGLRKEQIADYIGKELSEKAIADTKVPGSSKTYSGLDLKVGGEGMKGFYDKILPSEINKFFNKKAWGGAKVETSSIPGATDSITDEWAVIQNGQVLFQNDSRRLVDLYAKENGGEVVRGGDVNSKEVWSLPITPEMRTKALSEGMTQFKVDEAKAEIKTESLNAIEKVKAFFENPKLTRQSKTDLSNAEILFNLPSFFAEKIGAVKKIFDASQDRQDEFNEHIHYMENHDDKNVVEVWKKLRKASKQSFEKASKYLVDTDRSMEGFRVRQKKDGTWVAMDRAGKSFVEFPPDKKSGDTDKGEIQAVAAIMEAEAKDLLSKGYSQAEVEAVMAFRMATNKGFDMLFDSMRKLIKAAQESGAQLPKIKTMENGKSVEIDLNTAMAQMRDIRGYYFPRIRKPGRYVLRAFKDGEYSILETFTTRRMMNVRKAELDKNGYSTDTAQNEKLGEDVFEMAGSLVATQQIVNAALERVDSRLKNPSDEDINAIEKEIESIFASALAEQIANVVRERGARVHMTRRSPNVYVGYDEDPEIVIAKYIRGLSAGEAKRNMVMKMMRALTGTDVTWSQYKAENENPDYAEYRAMVQDKMIDQRKQENAFKWAKAYIAENTRNQEAVDRAIGMIKGIAVGKYLAFRVFSAPLVNLTALPTSAVASMKAAGIPYMKTWRLLGGSIKDYGMYRAGRGLTADQKRVFDHIHENGWDNPQFNSEALTTLRGAVGRKYDKIIEYGMLTFSESERLNRAATIAATYNGLARLNPEMSFDELMAKAKKVSDDSHGIYNRGNYPYIALGRHPAAHITRMFYVFRTFSHTYLANMYRIGFKEKDAVALAHMIFAPAVIAGAGASVLTPIISTLFKALGFDEPEEQAYMKIGELFGSSAENLARFGATSLLPGGGISLKGSLSIGIMDMPTSLTVKDFLGAPGSVIDEVFFQGPSSIARGDVAKGVEKILPTGLGNMIRSYRESTEGFTTRTNAPVFYGNEQLKLSLVESIYRGMSFNPARVAGIREKQWKERNLESKYTRQRTDIYAKIKRYVIEGDRDQNKWAEIIGEIQRYNEDAARWGFTPITSRTIKSNLKRSFRPSRRERERDAE